MFNKLAIICASLMLCMTFGAGAQTRGQGQLNRRNLVIKEWNTDVKSNKKMLDHVTTYNADGKKIEEIEYGSSGQKWRKRYEWGTDGRMTRELVYDERNHLVTEKKFEYNELGNKRIQYTYNAKGKLLTIKEFEYIVEDV